MPKIGLFEATIEVQDQKLPEYNDEELQACEAQSKVPTKATYVEVQSGQKFALRFRVHPGYTFPRGTNSLSWDIYLDGKNVQARLMLDQSYLGVNYWHLTSDSVSSMCGGQWVKYPFTFSDLDITQESVKGDQEEQMKKYATLGTIEIRVWEYYHCGTRPVQEDREPDCPKKSVSEKALKGRAVTLGAGLGDAVPSRASNVYSGSRVGTEPLAKFVFHYRSGKSLRDLMIIPNDDTTNDDIETMTADQLRLQLKQERAARAASIKKESKLKIKRERQYNGTDDEEDDEIREIRSVKKARSTKIEVIEID